MKQHEYILEFMVSQVLAKAKDEAKAKRYSLTMHTHVHTSDVLVLKREEH